MATYQIRQFGDPVLKQRAKDVEDVDGTLARTIDAMYETMYEADGGGLAAPQVGIGRRFFVFKTDDGPQVAINPEIVESSGETEWTEGCLSIPGIGFEIVRPELVTLRAVDVGGNEILIEADDYLGRMFQHEIDHLDGILAIDRVDPDERKKALRAIRDQEMSLAAEGVPARLLG
ncbi:MAG TPA: peptide deformylase [Acidimicrobiia bacterium]